MKLMEILRDAGLDRFFKNFKEPEYLYHLTGADTIENIKLNGLQIKYSKQHKFERGIYLADSIYTASNYSFLDTNREDYYIIEIPFKNLNPRYMKPDDYEMFDLLDDEYEDYKALLDYIGIERSEINSNLHHIYTALEWKHSLFISGQLKYIRDIEPSKFSSVYSKKEVQKKLNVK